uniref:40S ribosomal protein SA n=1 Tax=Oncorhynchus tshawytscha TaxID=74940 RepID=A0A8C8EY85_ONCTS
MSGPGIIKSDVLQMEEDVLKFLAAGTHLGGTNMDFQMEHYTYKRKRDGVYIINMRNTWEKLLLAARAIVAVENPADVCVISMNTGQLQLQLAACAEVCLGHWCHGRFIPGTFTNQIQAAFREPLNIPTIALCNTDSPLRYVDIDIPCNNKGEFGIGLWWMLSREVLRMRGTISREHPWEPAAHCFTCQIEKEEQAESEKAVGKEFQREWTAPAAEFTQPEVADWSEGMAVPSVPIYAQPATEDWSAAPTVQASEWGGETAAWS